MPGSFLCRLWPFVSRRRYDSLRRSFDRLFNRRMGDLQREMDLAIVPTKRLKDAIGLLRLHDHDILAKDLEDPLARSDYIAGRTPWPKELESGPHA